MVCCVVGLNHLDIINRFIRLIWKGFDIDEVVSVRKENYLVRFDYPQNKETVLNNGWYFVEGKPFMVKSWNKLMTVDTNSI